MRAPKANILTTIALVAFSALATGSGFIRELVISYMYGTSASADVYLAVSFYVEAISVIFLSGLAGFTTIPFLSLKRKQGLEQDGVRTVFSLATYFFLVSFVLFALVFLFPDAVVSLTLPGITGNQHDLATTMVRIVCLGVPVLIFTNFMFSVHRSFYNFNVVPFLRILSNLIIIIFTIILSFKIGILSVGVGILISILVQFVILSLKTYKDERIKLRVSLVDRDIPKLLYMMPIPFVVVFFTGFGLGGVEFYLLSMLQPGIISAVRYSYRILAVSNALLLALQSVFFAKSGRESGDDNALSINLYTTLLKVSSLLIVPLSIVLTYYSNSIIYIIYERGSFDTSSTAVAGEAFSLYAIAIPFIFIASLSIHFGFIVHQRKLSLLVSASLVFAAAAFDYVTITTLGHMAIPGGYLIGVITSSAVGLVLANRFIKKRKWLTEVTILFLASWAAGLLSMVIIRKFDYFNVAMNSTNKIELIIKLSLVLVCVGASVLGALWSLNISNTRELVRSVFNNFRKNN